LFDASALSVPLIQSLRTPIPDELKIEPIGPNHLKDGIMQREILDRFFQKRPFLEHGFGVVLTDAANAVHGFAMTNYPLDGSSEIEVMFRVGTNQDTRYRGRGIATTLASYFLEEAILRGYSPQWDAANDISAHIARKFGYTERLRWHMHHLIHPSE
jgi:GNAT superfamily N-acetyltransferase